MIVNFLFFFSRCRFLPRFLLLLGHNAGINKNKKQRAPGAVVFVSNFDIPISDLP